MCILNKLSFYGFIKGFHYRTVIFAMGNAFPELKKTADYVTKTNDDDGVAYAINKFVLKYCN